MKMSSRRRTVYRNQLIANLALLGFVAIVFYAAEILPYIMWVLPLILFFLVLWNARLEILPNAHDGSQWHGIMVVANPQTQQARTNIYYSDRIAFSDEDVHADISLNVGRRGGSKRSAIIYRRADQTWWVRNTGGRPMQIVASESTQPRPLPSRQTLAPSVHDNRNDALEQPLQAGDIIEFLDKNNTVVERFLFRGSTNQASIPNHLLPAGMNAEDADWYDIIGASFSHHARNIGLALLSVIITAGLLYLTDSGMQRGFVTIIDFGTSFASWKGIIFWHLLSISALCVLFVAVDASILIRSRSNAALGLRRPKSMLISLLALLIMTGTIVGFRNEGRFFGPNHIQQIIDDNTQSQTIQAKINLVASDAPIAPISVSEFLLTPPAQLPRTYNEWRSNMLSDRGTRNAEGNTYKTVLSLTIIFGLMAISAIVWSYCLIRHQSTSTLLEGGHNLRVHILAFLQNRPWWQLIYTNHMANLWLVIMLIFVSILVLLQSPEDREINASLIFMGITVSEIVRFGFFVTIIITIGQWAAQYQTTHLATMPIWQRWRNLQTVIQSRAVSLVITGVLLGAIAGVSSDTGPYLASIIFLLLVSMLYIGKYQTRWLQHLSTAWIGLVVVGIVVVPIILNTYRLELVANPLIQKVIEPNGAFMSWGIRLGEPVLNDTILQRITPLIDQGYDKNDLIDRWYTNRDLTGAIDENSGAIKESKECDSYSFLLCMRDQSMRQGLYAILAGAIHGMGPGLGLAVQADAVMITVPNVANAHTDFVMVTVFEEYGLIGGTVVMLIFYLLTAYLLSISQRIDSYGGQVLAAGLGIWWSLQVLMVIAGTLRLMPLTGISTPFLSYGLTNLLITTIMLALTIWVSTMPLRPINQKRLTRNQTYRILQVLLFFIHLLLVVIIFFMQLGIGIHQSIFQDIQQARTATPSMASYRELHRPIHLGNRIDCQYYRNPKLNDIVERNNQKLIYFQRFISGCYTTKQINLPAQGYGTGLDQILDTLINSPEYETRITASSLQGNVKLTLDGNLNRRVDAIFSAGTGANQNPVSGQVMVIDYQGRIRAFVNHQQRFADGTERYGSTNNPLTALFPPGSIWKVIIADAALRAGLTADTPIPCLLGEWIRGVDTPRKNAYGEASCQYAAVNQQDESTLRTSMAYSLNTTFMGLGDSAINNYQLPGQLPLTRDFMASIYADYGVIDVTRDERAIWSSNSLPATHAVYAGFNRDDYDNPNDSVWGTSLIGQGNVLVSPLSMAAIMQIIANDGVAQSIRLIDSDTNPAWHGTQRISAAQTAQLKELLYDTVRIPYENPINGTAYLAGAAAVIDGAQHLVGGKTGTAEVYDSACSDTNSECPNLNWFVGLSDQTQQIVIVMFRAHTVPSPCTSASIGGAIFAELLGKPQALPCVAISENQ
jgi:cell division protein FtsW (lipid II flippase)